MIVSKNLESHKMLKYDATGCDMILNRKLLPGYFGDDYEKNQNRSHRLRYNRR